MNQPLRQRRKAGLGRKICKCHRSELPDGGVLSGREAKQKRLERGRSNRGQRSGCCSPNPEILRDKVLNIGRKHGRSDFESIIDS
jgi:hypothetical protein